MPDRTGWGGWLSAGSWQKLFPCGGLSWSALTFLVLAYLGGSLLLVAGSSVLLAINVLSLVSLTRRCGSCSAQVLPSFHVLDLLLDVCYCDCEWFLFWEIAVICFQVLQPLWLVSHVFSFSHMFFQYCSVSAIDDFAVTVVLYCSWKYTLDGSLEIRAFILLASTSLVYLLSLVTSAMSFYLADSRTPFKDGVLYFFSRWDYFLNFHALL